MKPGRWLAVILVLYVALGVAYTAVVPLGEAPDEVDHFLYVRYLLEQHTFPVMQPVAEENATMEANQPPLFYLLNAAVTAPFPQTASPDLPLNACYHFTPGSEAAAGRAHFYLHNWAEQHFFDASFLAFRMARLLSVVMGAVTVGLVYILARQMAPARPSVWLLAAALLAFNPQFLFITASVNNDVLMALLGASIVAAAVSAATRGSYGRFALLGVLVGLGLLTKFALLALWPLAFLAVIGHRYSVNGKQPALLHNSQFLIHNFLLVTLLPLLIAGWWYGRAYSLYGDPLAWDVHLQAKGTQVLRTTPFTLTDFWDFGVIHFQSYWGWFGWLKLPLPGWVYEVIGVVVVLGIIGVIREMRNWRFYLSANRQSLISNLQPFHLALLFNLFAIAAIYISLLRYIQTINWSGYQGRLAFAAAASVAALLAVGVCSLNRRWLGTAVAGGLFALAMLALLFIILPAFPRPHIYQPPPDLPRTCILFAAGLQVEAVETSVAVKPGEWLPVTVYGYGLWETAVPQTLTARLTGRDGRVVGQTDTPLTWAKGDVLSATLTMSITDTLPARGVLAIGMVDETGQWQAATSVAGRVLTMPLGVQVVKIAPARPLVAAPEVATAVSFGEQLALLGYDYDQAAQTLTLYWQALAPIPADYTTFVHVLDENDQIITQADGQPQTGAYPTSVWDAGEIVVDLKPINIPAHTQNARFAIGVYLLETGERLSAHVAQDGLLLDDRFILPLRLD